MTGPRSDPLDWSVAARVAGAVAGPGPAVPPLERAQLRRDFEEFTAASDTLVREFTGLEPPAPAGSPAVVDRAGWVRVNVDTFRTLLAPVGAKLERAGGLGRRAAGAVLGAQIGVVLGYVARKVLGQYELFLAPGGGGTVYYVGPNVVGTERRGGLNPRDFRMWIALHEVTHRTQFTAVPWLREYVTRLVGRYLGSVEIDAQRLRAAAAQVRELLRRPGTWSGANLLQLFLSGEQREVLLRLQALMCVVEGHGNFVMDRIGASRIGTYGAMKGALAARREQHTPAQRLFERAIGIEMKYQQYTLGERFVSGVAERAGMAGVNRVWQREENLPTLEEIDNPAAWLDRVAP